MNQIFISIKCDLLLCHFVSHSSPELLIASISASSVGFFQKFCLFSLCFRWKWKPFHNNQWGPNSFKRLHQILRTTTEVSGSLQIRISSKHVQCCSFLFTKARVYFLQIAIKAQQYSCSNATRKVNSEKNQNQKCIPCKYPCFLVNIH